MFVSFAIDNEPIKTLEIWRAFIKKTSLIDQDRLFDNLRLEGNQAGLPNFTWQAQGKTLLMWARENLASYTLLQEVKLAG